MAAAFAHSLQQTLASLNLNPSIVHQLQSDVAKLGGLDAPTEVDALNAAKIRLAIAKAFVFGFRLIVVLCAVLALASAIVAWRKIPARSVARASGFRSAAAAD
jgi:hypothetical protein